MAEKERSLESKLPFGINPTKRFVSEGGERRLYQEQRIGTSGSVELVDYMGGDGTVERVATAGHGRKILGNPEQADLIRYLAQKGIPEPFSSVQLKFGIQSPILVALAVVYQTRASLNEYSGRYSVMLESSLEPDRAFIGAHSDGKHTDEILRILREARRRTVANYKELLGVDMARELARAGLGTDNDTKYFWKMDLLSLSRFVQESRRKFPAEHPTRTYVEAIAGVAGDVAPYSWDALTTEETERLSLQLAHPTDDEIVDPGLRPSTWGEQKTRRVTVPALEEILFVPKGFLDHGQVQAVDYMGEDNSLSEAARTSYGEGTKTLQDNKGLIKSLVRDAHTSPIEMAELAVESIGPMFSDPRQAGRHRTLDKHGFMGQQPLGSRFYVPKDSEFKYQDRVNRQGRGKEMDEEDLRKAKEIFVRDKEEELAATQALRGLGAGEEIARLPKGVGYHTFMWRTGDVHNWGNFLRLRLDEHAQMEVREYAALVRDVMSLHTPNALQAIMDYRVNAIGLSAKEIAIMRRQGMIRPDLDLEDLEMFKGGGLVITDKKTGKKKLGREGIEFKRKLERLMGEDG